MSRVLVRMYKNKIGAVHIIKVVKKNKKQVWIICSR